MSDSRRKLLLHSLKLFDVSASICAFTVAAIVVSSQTGTTNFAEFLALRIKVLNFILFAGLFWVTNLIFSGMGLYHSKRLSQRADELVDILKAVSFSTLVVSFTGVAFQIEMITWVFMAIFWSVALILLISSRLILRYVLSQIRLRGRNLREVLIIGTNSRAIAFAKRIESRLDLGYRFIGFVDQTWSGLHALDRTSYPLVCSLDRLAQFLRENVVDEVIIGLPLVSFYQKSVQISELCEKHGIIVRFLSNIFDLKIARLQAEDFEGQTLVTFYTGRMEGWPVLVKRMLDFALSLCLLILLSPFLLITALLIKLTSPGPILFTQPRVGLGKRRFRLYKFRTMVKDAEQRLAELEHLNEISGPVFKIQNDPRVTPLGKVLRRTSIDELPQLINVLMGDMSLVGPRPLPVRDYNGFDRDWYRRRFSVRPGITCLWQVNGRSHIPFERWMELDMEYIDQWSLWMDVKILMKTIPIVVKGSGAA